jgi:hypothetical protein|tara:strand:+ start:90 stop:440 length:351 start_codon:yes stop_codon:yes gene_type:complete
MKEISESTNDKNKLETTKTPNPDFSFDTNILDGVLSTLFKNVDSMNIDNNTKDDNENNDEDTYSNNNYDDLDLYLLDEKGNNVCDHIEKVNTTLHKINDSIQEFISIYSNIHGKKT